MGNPWEHVYKEREKNPKDGWKANVCKAAME